VPLEPVHAADGTVIDYTNGDRVQMFAFDRVRTRYDPTLVDAYARQWRVTLLFQRNLSVAGTDDDPSRDSLGDDKKDADTASSVDQVPVASVATTCGLGYSRRARPSANQVQGRRGCTLSRMIVARRRTSTVCDNSIRTPMIVWLRANKRAR
jgi:hypothetical protein